MAINTDKSDALRKGESNAVITSASPNTQKALNVLNKEIIRLISQILIDLTELNTACDNSFHWNDIEKNYRMYQNQILHCRHSFQSMIFLNK